MKWQGCRLIKIKFSLHYQLFGSVPIVDERIIEISIGEWEGKKKDSIDKDLLDLYRAGQYTPPGQKQHHKLIKEFVVL